MSVLLKAGDSHAQTGVRPLVSPASAPADREAISPAASALSADKQRIAELELEIEKLTVRLLQEADSAKLHAATAFTEGEETGRAKAEKRERERLDRLAQTMTSAKAAHAMALEKLEVLSLAVAQAALARIFGDRSRYANMIADGIRHQLAQVDRALTTQIRVSAEDFRDAEALAALAGQNPDIPLHADPALKAGDCTINLQLGQVEAGIAQQWQRLSIVLDRLATAEDGR